MCIEATIFGSDVPTLTVLIAVLVVYAWARVKLEMFWDNHSSAGTFAAALFASEGKYYVNETAVKRI